MDDRALVIGAGIGGLATAIALKQTGRDVLVLERAAELCEIGAGISLWPNAVNALRRLGIGDDLEAAGAPAHDAAFRSWRGAQLGASITTRLQERFGAPLVMVHRARLQGALRQALGPDIRLGAECAGLDPAMEDAVVLADELAATTDVVAALARYSARRARHTGAVVKASRQMSQVAHLSNPLAVGLRNTLLRASPPSLSLRRLAPIVGHVRRPALTPEAT